MATNFALKLKQQGSNGVLSNSEQVYIWNTCSFPLVCFQGVVNFSLSVLKSLKVVVLMRRLQSAAIMVTEKGVLSVILREQ